MSEPIQKLLGFNFCMAKRFVVWPIMDMKEAKSDVNVNVLKSDKKTPEKVSKKIVGLKLRCEVAMVTKIVKNT